MYRNNLRRVDDFRDARSSSALYDMPSLRSRPLTFASIKIAPSSEKPMALLVKSDEAEVINVLRSWSKNANKYDANLVRKWTNDGIIVPMNDDSESDSLSIANTVNQLELSSEKYLSKRNSFNRPSWHYRYNSNVFVNVGEDDNDIKLVRASVGQSVIEDIKSGKSSLDDLSSKGSAFTNISQLILDEELVKKGDSIALRLRNEFPITSDEWSRWINITSKYNQTTLTQALATYYREESVGDVGGKDRGYQPRLTFPGTLAPGENFKESDPFKGLPNYILHPWPAMQEIPFHVRWPVSHPIIFPPLLWCALNNMISDNVTAEALLPENDHLPWRGGVHMEARDAVRIAKYAEFGKSYRQEEQLKHGGLFFNGGHQIPFYNPDHGPTVSEEEANPPVPTDLLPIVQRWYDPDEHAIDPLTLAVEGSIDQDATDEDEEAMMEEELIRMKAAEKFTLGMSESLSEELNLDELTTPLDEMEALLLNPTETEEEMFPTGHRTEVDDDIDHLESDLSREPLGSDSMAIENVVEEVDSNDDRKNFKKRVESLRKKRAMEFKDPIGIPTKFTKFLLKERYLAITAKDDLGKGKLRGVDSEKDIETLKFIEDKIMTWDDDNDEGNLEGLHNLIDEQQVKRDMRHQQAVEEAAKGRSRSSRDLITYTVEIMTEMQTEILRAERSEGSKAPGRRRSKKRASILDSAVVAYSSDPFISSDSGSSGESSE